MKAENNSSSNNKNKLIAIVASLAVLISAIVIAVILISDGNVPEVSDDGTDTSAPFTHTETSGNTETDVETETSGSDPEMSEPKESHIGSDGFSAVNETVTAKELTNLRTEPSSDGAIAGILKNGETAVRTGIGNGGWSRLEYNGQTVYAITSYLTADLDYRPIDIPQADVVEGNTFTAQNDSVTAKELTNLRALPTTESEILGTLVSGEFIERTAVSDKGWSRLIYNGQTVYAVTSYLSNEVVPPYVAPDGFEAVDEYVTAKAETNLRKAPSVKDAEVVYTLKNGEYVRRIAVNSASGWSRLEWNGQTVYAVTSYLEVKTEDGTAVD